MAWRYREKDGDIVAVALIGDSVPERLHSSDRFREAQTQGYHCGGSAQGVIFRASSDAKTITKRNQVDIFCVEIPIEEPSFWLTTHEPPNR